MNNSNSIDFVTTLPEEVSILIFSQLSAIDLAKCNEVSKKWRQLTNDPSLWKPIFSSIHEEIKNKEEAKAFFAFKIKAKSKERMIEKIKNFFNAHNHHEKVIGMRYQSASNPEAKWFYFHHFTEISDIRNPEKFFNTLALKLSIVGSDEADLADPESKDAHNCCSVCDDRPMLSKAFSWIIGDRSPVLVAAQEDKKYCNWVLVHEIATKCGLEHGFIS